MRWFVVLAIWLGLAPITASAAVRSPCSVLTNAEVAKVFGASVAYRSTSGRFCTWNSAPLNGLGVNAMLRVEVASGSAAKLKHVVAAISGVVPVTGLGAAAFYLRTQITPSLWVAKRDAVISITATTVASPLSTEKAAARLVLKRV